MILPKHFGVHLALFANDESLYAPERNDCYVLRKLQCGLNSMAAWYESWNIKINEGKTLAIYFSHRIRPPDSLLAFNGLDIPFVNSVKYFGVIFDKKITWRLHMQKIKTKAFRTFSRIYPLFRSERLSTNTKLTLHKALSICNDLCLSRLGICSRNPSIEIAVPVKQGSPHHWPFSKEHIDSRYACSFPSSVCLR
jgi:hypothetical protein